MSSYRCNRSAFELELTDEAWVLHNGRVVRNPTHADSKDPTSSDLLSGYAEAPVQRFVGGIQTVREDRRVSIQRV